jgi:rod shape-determining protein MreB
MIRTRLVDVAVDLGSAYTRIVGQGRGVLLEEPTVVATQVGPRGRDVVAVGTEAREMIGRTPGGITVVRPVRGGVVADFEATEQLLRQLFARALGRSLLRPRVLVGVPTGTTEVQRRAVQDSARAAGAREVYLTATPLLAAIGADLPVQKPVGSMIVDLGAGRIEIGVTALGGLVVRKSAAFGGDALDQAIGAWTQSEHGVLIGERTAEAVKLRVGSAILDDDGDAGHPRHPPMRVRGRDLEHGAPREIDIRPSDVAYAVRPVTDAVRKLVLEALAETPPELAADLVDRGIFLSGGVAQLRGLDVLLRADTGLPVLQADSPARCAALGAAHALDDTALLDRILSTHG